MGRSKNQTASSAGKKKRVVTQARKEQNRVAQRLYRQRQKELRKSRKCTSTTAVAGTNPVLAPREPCGINECANGPTGSRGRETVVRPPGPSESDEDRLLDEEISQFFATVQANSLEFSQHTVFSAVAENALCLGMDLRRLAACPLGTCLSPFYQPDASAGDAMAASVLQVRHGSVPPHLRPTVAQILIPHPAGLDVIPVPGLRERIILLSAALPHLFSMWDFKVDIYVHGGLMVWRQDKREPTRGSGKLCQPWDMRSWEAAPWFLQKWSLVLDGERDALVKQSRWWKVFQQSQRIPFPVF